MAGPSGPQPDEEAEVEAAAPAPAPPAEAPEGAANGEAATSTSTPVKHAAEDTVATPAVADTPEAPEDETRGQLVQRQKRARGWAAVAAAQCSKVAVRPRVLQQPRLILRAEQELKAHKEAVKRLGKKRKVASHLQPRPSSGTCRLCSCSWSALSAQQGARRTRRPSWKPTWRSGTRASWPRWRRAETRPTSANLPRSWQPACPPAGLAPTTARRCARRPNALSGLLRCAAA